jgi:N-acetylglucosaminyl-diphospho-decaprenol L-rhamnosyltransferase
MLADVERGALEIVVIHHRTPTLLAQGLERLATVAPELAVLVVDTAFDTSLPRQLEGVHPKLRWQPTVNHSYAHAVNTGLKATRSPLVALMNADVLIGPATLGDLSSAFDDPTVALAGPLARTPQGTLQDLGVPYRRHAARLRWLGGEPGHGVAAAVTVPWLSGCLLMVRRSAALDVGGMDGGLRFANEDVEWAGRFRAAGYRCRLVATEVVHVGGASTPADVRFLLEGLRGGYALTRRTQPRELRAAHRWAVAAYAMVAARTAADDERRAGWREIARRFVQHDLDASPFGSTLGSVADPLTPPAARAEP